MEEEDDNDTERKSNDPEEPTSRRQGSLTGCHYYPQLTYLENLRLNLMSYQAHLNHGLTTADLQ